MLSPSLQKLIPPADRVLYKANAYRRRAARHDQSGGYPLVIFSHGFAGYPEQSVTLTTHLASWGFVVAAPDHVERSLDGLLGIAGKGVPKTTDLAVLQADAHARGERLERGRPAARLRRTRTGSSPPGTPRARAPRISSRRPIRASRRGSRTAVGFGGQPATGAGRAGQAGHGDARHDRRHHPPGARASRSTRDMHSPKYLVKIANAGHLVFSDICLIGRSKGGVIGIAKAIKLPIPPSLCQARFRRLQQSPSAGREGVPRDRSAERRVLPFGARASTRHRSASTPTRSPASAQTVDRRRTAEAEPHQDVYFWSIRATGWPAIATGKPSRRASPKAITLPSAVAIQ